MSRSGRVQNLAASPTLVGAITVLIAIVAVFLAYNANQGLPFVPTYRISATVPNANTLVPGTRSGSAASASAPSRPSTRSSRRTDRSSPSSTSPSTATSRRFPTTRPW